MESFECKWSCLNSFFKTLHTTKVEYMDGASALTSWPHHGDFLCSITNCQMPGECQWAGLELTEPWRTGSSQKQSNNYNIVHDCTTLSKTQLF